MRFSSNLNIIVKALDSAAEFILRDYNELQYIQNSLSSRIKFANSSYKRLKSLIVKDLSNIRSDYDIYFTDNENHLTNNNSGYFYHICPIDSIENYSRGNSDFAMAISLCYGKSYEDSKPISVAIKKLISSDIIYCDVDMGVFYNKRRVSDNYKLGDNLLINDGININNNNFKIDYRYNGSILSGLIYVAINNIDAIRINHNIYKLIKNYILINQQSGNVIIDKDDHKIICNKAISKLII